MDNVAQLESFVYNLTGYTTTLIVALFLVIIIAWFISQNAKNIIPKLIFSGYGIYLILSYPIMSVYTVFGIGLILPHITTIIKYFIYQFLIIKQLSINSYMFFLTIYYKSLNFIKWIGSLIKLILIFFTTFDFNKAKNSYEKENPKDNYEEQYKQYYKQEEFYTKNNSNSYKKNNKKEEKSYYKQEEQNTNENTSNNYDETKYQTKQTATSPYGEEYNQFFSYDNYIILGVSKTDDKRTIKKAFYKLAGKYHPDKNPEEILKFTDIFQRINNAYMTIGD